MSLDGFKLFADKFPESMLLLSSRGEILSVNRAACRLLQRPQNELLHQNISLICNMTNEEVVEQLKPCSRSRTPVQIALRPDIEINSGSSLQATAFLFTPATDSAPAHILLRPQKMKASSSQFAILKQDIAGKNKTLQAMRVAIEAAEAANQPKSNFLANISHELRTPMNAILGYSEILMEEVEDTGQDDFIPDLKKINQAGAHLLSLINDVLDLSKIESGKMEALTERMSVDVLIDEVASTTQPLMQSNNNHFKIERGEQLGDVYQDVTKLRQTMLNLLSNAAKFTHEGHVSLRVERSNIDDTDWLTFAVQDTGIAADKLEQVFEEFSQADNSTTRDYGGTGLGLTISRRFCKMMGGDLSVRSSAGDGSTFTMRVPALLPGTDTEITTKTEPVKTDPELEAIRVSGAGRTVLVIDDDPEARDIVKRFLRKDGFEVATACSGEEGLRLAHQLKPAAITLDVMMPDMDGWSVLRALKADPALQDVPVIVLTAKDLTDEDRNILSGRVEKIVQKGACSHAHLLQIIRSRAT